MTSESAKANGTVVSRPFWKVIPRFEPEYSVRDLARVVRSFVSDSPELDSELAERFPQSRLYLPRNGRECLYLILKALGLPRASRVGVPLYCCMSVFHAITAAGHIPVFLDIDLDSYSLDETSVRRNRTELDALIVVHTFGYPADLDQIRKWLSPRAIPIIEDCAHALFSTYKGRSVGASGDAAFFSFGLHKPAAVGGGALLLVNDPSIVAAAEREFCRTGRELLAGELRQALVSALRGMAYQPSVYGALMASPLGVRRDRDFRRPDPHELARVRQAWTPAKIRRIDRALLRNRIHSFEANMSALARNAEMIRESALRAGAAVPMEPDYGSWNHFVVPVRVSNGVSRDSVRQYLLARGVDTWSPFQHCAQNARFFGYEGGCPDAEEATRTVFTVPHHASLSAKALSFVSESLKLSLDRPAAIPNPGTAWHETSAEHRKAALS